MGRVEPLPLDALPGAQREAIARAEELMGFVANDALTMARRPALMDAFANIVRVIYAEGEIEPGFKRLIGMVSSAAAGCRYCVAHTAFAGLRHGIEEQKLRAVWDFETSSLFTPAEKAALRVAAHAAQVPSGVTDEMFAELRKHYTEDGQLEIVAVIALFGFLNRWNSTLATDLEALPRAALATARAGKHEEESNG